MIPPAVPPSDEEPRSPFPPDLEAEAARHLARRDRGFTADETLAFTRWLAASEQHRAVCAYLHGAWTALDALRQPPAAPIRLTASPIAATTTAAATAATILAFPTTRRRPWAPVRWLALAGGIAAAVAVLWLGALRPEQTTLTNPVGGTVSSTLDDGTRVQLNTDSRLALRYATDRRSAELERGEASFEITPDPARPFVVTAGGVEVRVVGTGFNLRLHEDRVEVLVTHGRVQVRPASGAAPATPAETPAPILTAGQRAQVARSSAGAPVVVETASAAETERLLAWREGRIGFSATPLPAAIAELARHHAVQFELADPALAEVLVSGSFEAADLAGFLHLLEAGFGVRVEHRDATHVRLRRAP